MREGFDVNVALLPPGRDPDLVVREEGGEAYQAIVEHAQPYLDFLVDRAVKQHDTATPAGRLAFLNAMLAVAASIPEAAARDQFADRLSLRAGISEDVVRDEIRKAAVARRTTAPAPRPVLRSQLTEAERDLLTHLMSAPADAAEAVMELEPADLVGLAARSLLESAQALARDERTQGRSGSVASRLLSELAEADVAFLTGLSATVAKPAPVADCIRVLKERRATRERQEIQRQIDAFQQAGGAGGGTDMEELLIRKCGRLGPPRQKDRQPRAAGPRRGRGSWSRSRFPGYGKGEQAGGTDVVDRREIRRSTAAHLHGQGEGLPALRGGQRAAAR